VGILQDCTGILDMWRFFRTLLELLICGDFSGLYWNCWYVEILQDSTEVGSKVREGFAEFGLCYNMVYNCYNSSF
jgi:hypothetical protein